MSSGTSQESDGGHHSSIHAKRMSPKSRRQSAVSKLSSLLISSPRFSHIVHVPHSQESCVRYRDRRIGCTNDATYKLLFLRLNNPGVSLVLMPRSFAAISRPQDSRLAFLMALPSDSNSDSESDCFSYCLSGSGVNTSDSDEFADGLSQDEAGRG